MKKMRWDEGDKVVAAYIFKVNVTNVLKGRSIVKTLWTTISKIKELLCAAIPGKFSRQVLTFGLAEKFNAFNLSNNGILLEEEAQAMASQPPAIPMLRRKLQPGI